MHFDLLLTVDRHGDRAPPILRLGHSNSAAVAVLLLLWAFLGEAGSENSPFPLSPLKGKEKTLLGDSGDR